MLSINKLVFASVFIFSIVIIFGCDVGTVNDAVETISKLVDEKKRQKNLEQQKNRYEGSLNNKPVYLGETEVAKQGRYFKAVYPDAFDVMDAVYKESFEALEFHFSELNKNYSNNDDIQTEKMYSIFYGGFGNTDPRLEDLFNKWINQYPDSHTAYTARGLYYKSIAGAKRGGKYISDTEDHQIKGMHEYLSLAKNDLLKAIELNDHTLMAYNGLLGLYNLTGDDRAEQEVQDKVLSIFPKSIIIRSTLIFSLQPKWGGSIHEIEQLIQNSKKVYEDDDPRLEYLRNYLHYTKAEIKRRTDRKAAIPLYDAAVGDGNHSLFLYARGSNYYYLKQYDKALEDLDAAIKRSPYLPGSRLKRSRVLEKLGRNEEALEDLNVALEIDSFDEDYLRARGDLHRTLGNYKLAEIDLTNSLVYGSTERWNWHMLAEVYLFDYKNYEEGEKVAKKGLVFHPRDEFLWYDLAIAQSQLFNCEVMDTFKKFLKICKKQDCSEQNINWIKNSQEIFKQRKFCA